MITSWRHQRALDISIFFGPRIELSVFFAHIPRSQLSVKKKFMFIGLLVIAVEWRDFSCRYDARLAVSAVLYTMTYILL